VARSSAREASGRNGSAHASMLRAVRVVQVMAVSQPSFLGVEDRAALPHALEQ
jgi:hypothetical protein